MKARKAAGGLLFGLGCAAAFVGLLATVLPLIDNDQLRLVLSSFAMPSENGIVNAINAVMTYALHNCYAVLLAGLGAMAGGAALLLWKEDAPERKPPQREWEAPVNEGAKRPEVHAQPPMEPESNPFADFSMQELLIWKFYYENGFSCAEIGEKIGISESNTKVKLFRMRQKLKSCMEE